MLEARPESQSRKETLQEEIATMKAEQDDEILTAAMHILMLVQSQQVGMGKFNIQSNATVQGQTIGDYQHIMQNYYINQDKTVSFPAKPQRVWNVPFPRNPFFLGQEDLLSRLHTRLQQGTTTALTQTQAISGLGGIGKTQIAIEYAYRYQDVYPFVFWVRAEYHETLMSDLVSFASQLQLAEQHETDQTKMVTAVKQWLATHQGWLLIFDNADDVSRLTSFLPGRHAGAIVLTTRATQTQPIAEPLLVEQMDERTGAEFLLRRARFLRDDQAFEQVTLEDQQAAHQLCQLVGGLPLALDQAGAYIDETKCSIQDYLNFYQRDQQARAKLLQRRGEVIAGHPEPVATTWALAFVRVEQASTAAADLLRACAFLAPDLIPEELLQLGASHWGKLWRKWPVMLSCGMRPSESCSSMFWCGGAVSSGHSRSTEWYRQCLEMRWMNRASNSGQIEQCELWILCFLMWSSRCGYNANGVCRMRWCVLILLCRKVWCS